MRDQSTLSARLFLSFTYSTQLEPTSAYPAYPSSRLLLNLQPPNPQPHKHPGNQIDPTLPRPNPKPTPTLQNLPLLLLQLAHSTRIRVNPQPGESGAAHQFAGQAVVVFFLFGEGVVEGLRLGERGEGGVVGGGGHGGGDESCVEVLFDW